MAEPSERPDPMRTCAYSGKNYPESEMVRIGEQWVAIEHKDAAVQFLHQGNEMDGVANPESAPPVRLGALLSKAWEIYRRHGLLFCALYLTVNAPCNFLQGYMQSRMTQDDVFKLLAFSLLVVSVISSLGTGAIYNAVGRIWSGRSVSYGAVWSATLASLGSIVLASLSFSILFTAGFFLCFIPGLIVAVRLAFYLCFVIDGGRGAWPSIEASTRLTRGRFWHVFGCTLAVSIPLSAPIFIFSMLTAMVPAMNPHWLVSDAIISVLSLPMSFFVVFSFVYYKALLAAPVPANA